MNNSELEYAVFSRVKNRSPAICYRSYACSVTTRRRFATVHPFRRSKGVLCIFGSFLCKKKEIGPLKGPILTIMSTRTLKDETRPHTGCERLTALSEHNRPPVYSPSRTDCRDKLPFASVGEPLIAALCQKLADVPQCRIAAIPLLA